jgi:LuxR family maltose regulon positive regulatory protein
LFGRLDQAARVAVVSGPAGSGKTALLRAWIDETGRGQNTAWVSMRGYLGDAHRFWIKVAGALGATAAGSELVQPLTSESELDPWAIVDRLVDDLAPLREQIWLILDDVQEFGPASEAMAQLESFLLCGPAELRFVLATRCEPRLGLHRLRLGGELTEIRAADLQFSLAEAGKLFAAAGVELSEPALALLHQRTEGWAAGLRLAALSLTGHPNPEGFAAEFSGSERTVADYLLAEVLDRQSEEVRRLLVRTSILERVCGPVADALTGGSDGERALQELEAANAFVVTLDTTRSWFRFHPLFADLLRMELRRTAPTEIPELHRRAASWFADRGLPVDAIHHAQGGGEWDLAAGLLSDHWTSLFLDGHAEIAHDLLAAFPPGSAETDARLAALSAADELAQGSLEAAEQYLRLAEWQSGPKLAGWREPVRVLPALVRLSLAERRGNLPAAAEEARYLLDPDEAARVAPSNLEKDLRAVVLICLGTAEVWAGQLEGADQHLEDGIALAHRNGRPYLEAMGLALWALIPATTRSLELGAQRSRQAIELAERHGWVNKPMIALAYAVQAVTLAWQGSLDEAERCFGQAMRAARTDLQPPAGPVLGQTRGLLELARGHEKEAVAAFRSALRLATQGVTPHFLATAGQPLLLHALLRMGEALHVEAALAEMGEQERASGEMHTVLADLRLVQGNPKAATTELALVEDRSAFLGNPHTRLAWAALLEAAARDALGDAGGTREALERALDRAERYGAVLPFLLNPVPGLLERHARRGTAHRALITQILDLQAGRNPEPLVVVREHLRQPLTRSEVRILNYLPTNLTAPEIADELYLSVNTVKMHMRNLYAKLGAHQRSQAVERARELGLLAASALRR